jgi:hypothetical protein
MLTPFLYPAYRSYVQADIILPALLSSLQIRSMSLGRMPLGLSTAPVYSDRVYKHPTSLASKLLPEYGLIQALQA